MCSLLVCAMTGVAQGVTYDFSSSQVANGNAVVDVHSWYVNNGASVTNLGSPHGNAILLSGDMRYSCGAVWMNYKNSSYGFAAHYEYNTSGLAPYLTMAVANPAGTYAVDQWILSSPTTVVDLGDGWKRAYIDSDSTFHLASVPYTGGGTALKDVTPFNIFRVSVQAGVWGVTGQYQGYVDNVYIGTVPEPMSILSVIMGLGSLAGFGRLRRK